MEKIFEQALLYDFYGELLTEHQRSIYEDAVYNDMSLGESAEERGISRQVVNDLIKRCDKILQDYEKKLHLVERFSHAKEKIREIVELTEEEKASDSKTEIFQTNNTDIRMKRIRELSMELMEDW
ncbi:MAG: DNA-binding protein [Acetatifactor sp.]|nr:DNA-binding protein [Acetatifactor sp.]